MQTPRMAALRLCCKIEKEGTYSNLALQDYLRRQTMADTDKHLLVRLVYGVVQQRLRLDYLIAGVSKTKPSRMEPEILNILRIAVYQAEFMDRIPDYALVNESVMLAKEIGLGKYSGFVNGVLRTFLRERTTAVYPKAALHYLSTYYSYPQWLVKLVRDKYKDQTEKILKHGNEAPPVCIRVNRLKHTREELKQLLDEMQIDTTDSEVSEDVLILKQGIDCEKNTLFCAGEFTPQDSASALAARVLNPQAGQTVIDVCSAPGGKTTSLAEQMRNRGKIFACDIYPHKLKLVQNAANRLGIDIIETKQQDASVYLDAWGESADRVLVDAPCSGLGIIRRKPEIKWTKHLSDIQSLSKLQYQILETAARYVKPGGELVYSTCTLTNEENNDIFYRFLREHPQFEAADFSALVPDCMKSRATTGSLQILPGELGCDGFYIAKMKRTQNR